MQRLSPFLAAIAAAVILLGLYFSVLTIVSGWSFTIEQFGAFWPYILPLSFGFGIQVGLFTHLRNLSLKHHHATHVLAASGATSTAAMLACCTHYLANVLPILGAIGVVTLAAEYQVELFGIGLAFNVAGIAYIGRQVWLATRAYKESPAF